MLHPSTKLLIDKLSEMTRKQRVAWDEGENGQIVHDTEGYRVILTPAPHAVLLTDVLGKEIETCSPDDIAAEADRDGRPYVQFIAELYREASRHARGTERAIDAVLRGLDRNTEDTQSEPIAEDPSTVVLAAEDAIEDLADESDVEEFVDIEEPLIEASPVGEEIEGENEMTRAIEAMAEEVNNHETIAEEPVIEEEAPAPTIELPDFDTAPNLNEAQTSIDASPSIEEPAPLDSETIDLNDAAPLADTPAPAEAPASKPVTAPSGVAAMGAGGFFGSSLGDLSRYRTQQATQQIETEKQTEPAAPSLEAKQPTQAEPSDVQPEPASPVEAETPVAPETAAPSLPPEEPAPQASPRKFSLSGLTSGFGLGTAAEVEPPVETAPAVEVPAQPQKVIDGTVDLPDFPATPESSQADKTPPISPSEEPPTQSIETKSDEWVVHEDPIEPKSEPETEDPVVKKPAPFNPWN